jgi:hypothetical protein
MPGIATLGKLFFNFFLKDLGAIWQEKLLLPKISKGMNKPVETAAPIVSPRPRLRACRLHD